MNHKMSGRFFGGQFSCSSLGIQMKEEKGHFVKVIDIEGQAENADYFTFSQCWRNG